MLWCRSLLFIEKKEFDLTKYGTSTLTGSAITDTLDKDKFNINKVVVLNLDEIGKVGMFIGSIAFGGHDGVNNIQ